MYAYRIHGDDRAVRLVFRTGGGAYWGIEETNWDDAPVLADKSFRHVLERPRRTTSTTTARSCT